MTLLQPAVSSSAFLKMGILGFQGGGKTLTAAKTAIGLVQYLRQRGIDYATKPVAMLDTEKGSDWLIPIFEKAKVPFVVSKKKAFADMLKIIDEAEAMASTLIIDSITHPWRELVESYLRKKERSYLAMDDWGYLKGEHGWQQFTDRFINSKLHIIMCGRAGYEYENYVEDGRKKMEKVGTKMKTEGETGFEPDLLVLMEQVEDMRTNKVVHRATVQKDRSTLLDGQQFINPDFKDFLPHIECLALGGQHVGIENAGNSQHIIRTERRDWTPTQRRIVIDKIQTHIALKFPGQTAVDKTGKLKLILEHFNTVWTEIEEAMALPDLKLGYDSLHRALYDGKPSEYASELAPERNTTAMNDSLPDHSAPPAATSAPTDTPIGVVALEAQLLADIANNTTNADCLRWALAVSSDERLSKEAINRLNVAIMAHQNALMKQSNGDVPDNEPAKSAQPQKNGEPAEGNPGAGERKPARANGGAAPRQPERPEVLPLN